MLRLTLEEWPGGDEKGRRAIGIVTIENVTNLAPVSNYLVRLFDKDGARVGEPMIVGQHPRSLGAWVLVTRALEALGHPGTTRGHAINAEARAASRLLDARERLAQAKDRDRSRLARRLEDATAEFERARAALKAWDEEG